MQISLSIERMTLPVLVIVLPRLEGRVAASESDVGSKAGILCFELPPERLYLTVQVQVFFFEFAHPRDGWWQRGDLFGRDGQGVL